jgi:hypothetical protein
MTTIAIDEQTAAALRELEDQARCRHISLGVHLGELARWSQRASNRRLSMEEFRAVLKHLGEGATAPGMLPPDFNRQDIYYDHD